MPRRRPYRKSQIKSQIKRLSLTVDPDSVVHHGLCTRIARELPQGMLSGLIELNLYGFDLDSLEKDTLMLKPLPNFSSLRRLSLIGCTGTDHFLRKLGAELLETKTALEF